MQQLSFKNSINRKYLEEEMTLAQKQIRNIIKIKKKLKRKSLHSNGHSNGCLLFQIILSCLVKNILFVSSDISNMYICIFRY